MRAPKRPVSSQHKAMKMMTLCNLEKISEGGRDILSLGKNLMSGNLVMVETSQAGNTPGFQGSETGQSVMLGFKRD